MSYQPDEPSALRWYDRHKTVSRSVKLIETFPEEIQVIIAQGIISLAERECQARELMSNLRSLGPDKVLGIFKSKNRRRSYDQSGPVHQAMNYLFILSEENRLFVASQVIEIVNYIYEYLKSCKRYEIDANHEDVVELTQTYIDSGAEEAKQLLVNIQEKFSHRLAQGNFLAGEDLLEDRDGMRIREEKFPRDLS